MTEASEEKLKQAVEIYAMNWLDSLPTDEELRDQIQFSDKFEARMRKLIRRQKKPYYRFVNTAMKRVAVIFVAVVLAFSAMMSVEAIRTPVINFFIEIYERFTAVTFPSNDDDIE